MIDPLLLTCLGVAHDLPLLPHWLDHYRSIGVRPERIHVILNAQEDDHPGLAKAEAVISAAGAQSRRWIAPYTSESMWRMRREVQAELAQADDWVLSADIDEFHDYPGPLSDILDDCARLGVTCLQGVFIDRIGEGGRLPAVAPTPSLEAQFPIRCDVMTAIGAGGVEHGRGGTVKIMAMRGYIRPHRGGHRAEPDPRLRYAYARPLADLPALDRARFRFSVPTRVDHYHWTATLPERLRTRLATPGVSAAGAEYGRKQLEHFERHGGIDIGAAPIDTGKLRMSWRVGRRLLWLRGKMRTGVYIGLAAKRRLVGG